MDDDDDNNSNGHRPPETPPPHYDFPLHNTPLPSPPMSDDNSEN